MPLLDDDVPPESGAWKSVYCGAGPFATIGSLAAGSNVVVSHARHGGFSARRLGGGLAAADGFGVTVRSTTEVCAAAMAACCTNAAMRISGGAAFDGITEVCCCLGICFASGGAFDFVCIAASGAADEAPLLHGGMRLPRCHEF